MKWLLLLSLIACANHRKGVEEATSEGAAQASATTTEKPASPYTVKPCYCMKIFQPVCADGQSFGNSCEAECQGHKKWKEGSCPEVKKTSAKKKTSKK